MDKKLETAITAAKVAGEVALRYFRTALEVEYKGDASPVTVADRECEKSIVETLRAAFPDYGVLGEEFGEREGTGARWIVDPIDGTKNFIRGIPYFATLIALEEEGEVTTGVIYAPAVDDLLYAQRGSGAFDKNGRLRVSDVRNLNDGTVEGMRHKELPIFSVQYHPEAAPGPHDASYFFEQFAELIENSN